MPQGLRPHFEREVEQYRVHLRQKKLSAAWHHLERAHILGQPWAVEHSVLHWEMLKFGFKIKSWKEIRGQILRLIFGGVKSFVGKIPTGNTGGANVRPLLAMDLPEDLEVIMATYR